LENTTLLRINILTTQTAEVTAKMLPTGSHLRGHGVRIKGSCRTL